MMMDGYFGWLQLPMQLHSSRDFECGDKTPLQCAWYQHRWHFWYVSDLVFGLSTTYFCVAIVGLFLLGRILRNITPKSIAKQGIHRDCISGLRYLSYKTFYISPVDWHSPPLGVLFLGAVSFAFFFSMMLGPKPYYWPTFAFGQPADFGSSPPIATRSGWMALALFPFVIGLPMKLNLISIVTGISHERLQVFHRWSAFFMLILGMVHTFPFIIHDIDIGMMEMEWATDPYNKSGVATLIVQAYLTLFSWGPIRNRFYEIFKFTHILAAVLFAVFFFVHCNHTLTSWDYFIAAGVVYFLPYTISLIRTYVWYNLAEAELDLPTANLLHININVKKEGLRKAHWKIGQHMFLRFLSPQLGLHCITSHPFTICSYQDDDLNPGYLTFYVKPRGGITARLASIASKTAGARIRVFLDGPYSGVDETVLPQVQQTWIIAGGSGAGFTLPVIEHYLRHQQKCEAAFKMSGEEYSSSPSTPTDSKTSDIGFATCNVVFSSRDHDIVSWYGARLSEITERYPHAHVNIKLHNTAPNHTNDPEAQAHEKSLAKETIIPVSNSSPIHPQIGRPNLPAILADAARAPELTGKDIGVVVCGPASMNHDVQNVCADLQRRMLFGDRDVTVGGVYLHAEAFGW